MKKLLTVLVLFIFAVGVTPFAEAKPLLSAKADNAVKVKPIKEQAYSLKIKPQRLKDSLKSIPIKLNVKEKFKWFKDKSLSATNNIFKVKEKPKKLKLKPKRLNLNKLKESMPKNLKIRPKRLNLDRLNAFKEKYSFKKFFKIK